MSIIQAYKSDADGKLFEFRADYQKHLRSLAAARRKEKMKVERENRRLSFVERMRTECGSFDALKSFLLENWADLTADGSKLEAIKFEGMEWYEAVSNTHSCPKGGVTNWWSKKDLPKSYPGWQGRIFFKITSKDPLGGSNALDRLGIHSGTGGPSNGYDVKVFADDFPGMTKDIVWKKLKV